MTSEQEYTSLYELGSFVDASVSFGDKFQLPVGTVISPWPQRWDPKEWTNSWVNVEGG